jgi:hypothetical protein
MVMGETPYQKPKLSGSCCGSRPSISGAIRVATVFGE